MTLSSEELLRLADTFEKHGIARAKDIYDRETGISNSSSLPLHERAVAYAANCLSIGIALRSLATKDSADGQ